MTDFETWMQDIGKYGIFRYIEFRRPGDWTPFEMDKKFSDESRFVDTHMQKCKIREVVELPDGDILLGLQNIFDFEDLDKPYYDLEYFKLSEIRLSYFEQDQYLDN